MVARQPDPKRLKGRARIAAVQRKRWEEFRAANPRLFQSELSASQERRIKALFREFKARKALNEEKSKQLVKQVEENYKLMQERKAELQRQRKAAVLPVLTSEQTAQADRFLEQWTAKGQLTKTQRWIATQLAQHGYAVRKPVSATESFLAKWTADDRNKRSEAIREMSAQSTHSNSTCRQKPKTQPDRKADQAPANPPHQAAPVRGIASDAERARSRTR